MLIFDGDFNSVLFMFGLILVYVQNCFKCNFHFSCNAISSVLCKVTGRCSYDFHSSYLVKYVMISQFDLSQAMLAELAPSSPNMEPSKLPRQRHAETLPDMLSVAWLATLRRIIAITWKKYILFYFFLLEFKHCFVCVVGNKFLRKHKRKAKRAWISMDEL